MIVVSDTSPITALLQIGQLALLRKMYGEILIPAAVESELRHTHPLLPDFLKASPVLNTASVTRLAATLDRGEAEAIVLAVEKNADLVLIDEKPGRAAALNAGLKITGLVGVLVQARREGLLHSVRDTVHLLETHAGFFISEAVKSAAAAAAGE